MIISCAFRLPQFSSSAPPRFPAPPFDHFPFGPAILRRRVPSGTCARVRRNFSPWPAGRCEGEEAAEGRKCEGGEGRASVHDTTYDPLFEEPLSGGPTILFECPAQGRRHARTSFTVSARHPAAASAKMTVRSGAADFFPV